MPVCPRESLFASNVVAGMNPVQGEATKAETEAALERLIGKLAAEKKTTLPKPSSAAVTTAAKDFAYRLHSGKVSYYLCGGFACVYLCGSGRVTADIDVVAADNTNFALMLDIVEKMPNVVTHRSLSNSPLYYHRGTNEFVEMDCLPAGWGENFPKFSERGFGLETKDQISFLTAPELLRLKFRSWADPGRALKPEKRQGDQMDILSLRKFLKYGDSPRCVDKSTWGDKEKAGLKAWIELYKDSEDWNAIGLV